MRRIQADLKLMMIMVIKIMWTCFQEPAVLQTPGHPPRLLLVRMPVTLAKLVLAAGFRGVGDIGCTGRERCLIYYIT